MTDAIAITDDVVVAPRKPLPGYAFLQIESEGEDDGLRFFRSTTLADIFFDSMVEVGRPVRRVRIPAEGEPCPIEALRACVEEMKNYRETTSKRWLAVIALAEAVLGVKA